MFEQTASRSASRRGFLASSLSLVAAQQWAASAAGATATSARASRRAREAAGRPESGKLMRQELATPALLLDLDAFERNVAKMAAHCKAAGRGLRPHAKTHKCPDIARAQVRAGAAGVCVGTLYEAEVMAAAGIPGLLLTSELVGKPKLTRLMKLLAAYPDVMVVTDNVAGAQELSEAAVAAKVNVNVMLDVLVGGRTGITPGAPALELAQQVARLPKLKLRGLQAYAGQASHVIGFDKRRELSLSVMSQAVETRQMIEKSGIEASMISAGSTGTYNIDVGLNGITELQPGSYVFMDVDYRRIGGQSGEVYTDFAPSLTVVATVISLPRPKTAVVDAGLKAFSTDKPFTPECVTVRGIKYAWAGDEHGRLDFSEAERELRLGERLEFIIPHCDPSVNLYDRLYALRGDRVDAVWPIAARGYKPA